MFANLALFILLTASVQADILSCSVQKSEFCPEMLHKVRFDRELCRSPPCSGRA